jgi:hypothetical protein
VVKAEEMSYAMWDGRYAPRPADRRWEHIPKGTGPPTTTDSPGIEYHVALLDDTIHRIDDHAGEVASEGPEGRVVQKNELICLVDR